MRRIAALTLLLSGCTPAAAPENTAGVASTGATVSAGAGATAETARVAPPEIAALVREVDPARVKRTVETLAGFGTRHTLSDTTSPTRGIGAARRWLKAELERYAAESGRSGDVAMTVSFDAHVQPADGKRVPRDTEIVNVMAVLPGAMPEAKARRYYVVGHYDSRATDPMDATSDAPGANDDASGVAVVLELARVMAKRRFDATLVFLCTAGEEQGLYGAKLHAAAAKRDGLDVRAVLNNDIVGDPSAAPSKGEIRLFSEGIPAALPEGALAEIRKLSAESDSASRQIARFVDEIAALHGLDVRPRLVFRADRFLRGGDHLAFAEAGFPAVRFTDVAETYARQHQDVRTQNGVAYGDVPAFVDGTYLAGVARINGAALAHLASAPSSPGDARVITADLSTDTTLRWSASPEPDVAGYEIVWRPTTTPTWVGSRGVGRATEARVPMSKDELFFGVRAIDKAGFKSPVSFARAAAK